MTDTFLSVEVAARRLDCSARTLRRKINAGEICGSKHPVTGIMQIGQSVVDELLNSRTIYVPTMDKADTSDKSQVSGS